MAVPFQPSVSLSQSADGTTIIVTDTSNYSTNTDGVTLGNIISRTDTIIDGLNNPVQVVNFSAGLLTAQFTITKDYYLNSTLSFVVPGPTVVPGTDNFLASNFYSNAAREVARSLRACNCNDNLCNNAVKADLAYNEAVTSTLFGVASEAQNAIDAANLLIAQEDCLC